MRILLDLSEINAPWLSTRAKNFILPAKSGNHQADFDFIECDIPKDIFAEWSNTVTNIDNTVPLAFDVNNLPVGAKIIVTGR